MVVWVRFPHVPIRFYHPQVLTSLGNLVGRTVKIDANTQRADRGKFARLAVEINLNEPLAPVVSLDGVLQPVEYESIPNLFFRLWQGQTPCIRLPSCRRYCAGGSDAVIPDRSWSSGADKGCLRALDDRHEKTEACSKGKSDGKGRC
ncbi:hypothetical protein LINPERHAP1_LOCUS27794 [Linum perenne]